MNAIEIAKEDIDNITKKNGFLENELIWRNY